MSAASALIMPGDIEYHRGGNPNEIELPYNWEARIHQVPLFDYMFPVAEDGSREYPWKKRALGVWHRRAGKDSASFQVEALASQMQVGTYWHMLPTLNQGRKVAWEGIDKSGRRMIDQAFPKDLRESTNQTDMQIRFKNGSVWQVVGSDNYDSLIGTNPLGVVFSEYSVADPEAWNYLRPILRENDGWAIFIYTPRGKNHGFDLYNRVKENARWYVSLLTVEDTRREDGTRIVTDEDIQEERDDGMSEEMIRQEFYCSFSAGVVGAYWAHLVEEADNDGRIGDIAYDPLLATHLYFDIGIDDATAVWFGQRHQWQRRWFKYMEWRDTPLIEVFDEIARMPYRFAYANLPHDARQREKGTGNRIEAYAEDIFDDYTRVVTHKAYGVQESIEAAGQLLRQSWFDREECARGLDCLMNYRKVYDPKRKTYQAKPYHDWASHGSDAFRLAGMQDIDDIDIENFFDHNRTGTPQVKRTMRYG